MVMEHAIKPIASVLVKSAAKRFSKELAKKRIKKIVHKASPGQSGIISVLCQDKNFVDRLFQLARGTSIDGKSLVDLGETISAKKIMD